MMTTQFRFYTTVEEAEDKRTNVYKLKWIQPVGTELYYEFPKELQSLNKHPEICSISKVKTVLTSMKTRGTYRTFTLALPSEIATLYSDAEGDIVYKEIYLQATTTPEYEMKTTKKEKEEDISTLLQQIVRATKTDTMPTPVKNLRKVREDFILQNFDGKNLPSSSWFQTFEKECERCQVTSDEDKILILRLYLDGTAKNWYASKVITIGLQEDFDTWKKSFLNSFRETGWQKNREAYCFRYIGGSLVDYAIRKENLLVNIRENFPTDILIDLIVTDLPIIIQDKMEKTKVTSMEDLLAKLRTLESLVEKRKAVTKTNSGAPSPSQKNQTQTQTTERKPCPFCDKKGFPGRFHPEALCRLKQNEQPKNIRTVNNVTVQDTLNETITDSKN